MAEGKNDTVSYKLLPICPSLSGWMGGLFIFTVQTWRPSLLQGLTVLKHQRGCMKKKASLQN